MHGFVKKGLLLSLAAGSVLAGGAGTAAADSATADGAATNSGGLGSGNVAQGAADVPVQVCGDAAGAGAVLTRALANDCTTEDNTAGIRATTTNDPGTLTGDIVGAALNAPVQACGVSAAALGMSDGTAANTCDDRLTSAWATAATTGDQGIVAGDAVQAAANAPIQVCGDAVSVATLASGAKSNSCSNG